MAHPRVSGENGGGSRKSIYDGGSSPRERGKRKSVGELLGCLGLIPA